MMRTTALSLIRESETGDAWSGQDRGDSAGPLSGGPFDQGDQLGFGGVPGDDSEGFASGQLAPEGAKPVHHPGEDPVETPEMEILPDRRSRRKTKRKRLPLASGVAHALDRVEHLPKVGLAGGGGGGHLA